MKRNVEYFVYNTESLKKSQSLEEKINEVREANKHHFVITHQGELIRLNDDGENIDRDSELGVEFVHLLVLAPPPGFFNTLVYFFHLGKVGKTIQALKNEFQEASGIPVSHYYDLTKILLAVQIEKTELLIKELQLKIREKNFRMVELDFLSGKARNN